MSYILDALKKSEQQRGNGKIPDVQTVHSSSLNYRDEKKAYWPYILIVAIVLNLIAIIYFIVDKDSTSKTITSDIETTTTIVAIDNKDVIDTKLKPTTTNKKIYIENSAEIIADEIPKLPPEPARNTTTPNDNSTDVKVVSTSEKIPENNAQETIVEYHDLPESILRQIPTITVSAHVYSSNPLQRSIVINNNFLEEGDYVLDNLTLHEITIDGAIFDLNGTRFNYGIVSGWQ